GWGGGKGGGGAAVQDGVVKQQKAAFALGEPTALQTLEDLSPEYAWLPTRHSKRAKDWFRSHGYRIDVETPSSFVAVRNDLPIVSPVSVTPSGCFPGAVDPPSPSPSPQNLQPVTVGVSWVLPNCSDQLISSFEPVPGSLPISQ